ncbi:MAG TPA: hypothetical protein VK668_22560 [Mucilaginibacter sp.]|nr:hypothetical protein [Mucilaginibacter sp.]
MRFFYKALFITLFLPLFSLAQSNYKPGYIVDLKGDTTRGFIDYGNWDVNPTSINFKTAITDGKARKLTPAEINFCSIDGLESFQRYAGPITTDATNQEHLSEGRDSSFRMDEVFLKVLQKGKLVALFSYSDNLKTRFYIGENPGYTPAELEYRAYYDQDAVTQTKGRTVNENTYIRQLLTIASKNNLITEDFQQALRDAAYRESFIIDMVNRINGVTKAEFKKSYSGKTKINWFVGAGININQYSPASSSNYYNAGGRAHTSYLPQVSFGINVLANPNTGKLLFRIEGSLAQSQYKYSYLNTVYPYVDFKTNFDELTLSLSPQVIYNIYNGENLKVFFGAGATVSYFKFSNIYYGPHEPNPAYNGASNNAFYFNTFDDMFLVKAGVQIGKRWIVYGNYFSNSAATRLGYFAITSSCKQIGLNYLFQ